MRRRRDDPCYIRSAVATVFFYGALLAVLAGVGYLLRWGAVVGLAGLLVYLYRGELFGLASWPKPLDVEALLEEERRLRCGASERAPEDQASEARLMRKRCFGATAVAVSGASSAGPLPPGKGPNAEARGRAAGAKRQPPAS